MATSQRPSLLPGAENHRHGRVSGDDGEARIVRTFHARFGSVKLGGAVTARTRIAYVHREGKHAGDAADVEATAGDKEKVIEASDRIRDTARVRRGKTAERLLATQVIELPLESTAEQRQACADAFVADWRGRGHQAVAVVHVHGEEHKQPHLHVEIAARPVGADGAVDRAATRLWAGGHPAVEVKKERARAADIVNRTCDPDPPYHPGGFRDIGVERQPRTRIPAGKFRKAREEIRDARAADDTDGAARIEAKAYAVSDEERGEKREARLARTAEIIEFKAAGLPPRPSQRARLAFAEDALEAERDRAGAVREAHSATVARAVQGLEQAGDWLGEARARADRAEASVATLTDEKQQAEDRARELEARQVQPLALTEKQRPMLEDVCARHGIEGDIGNDAQAQLRAFAALHEERDAWYHYYEKREAGEKRRAEERDEQRARAEAAEASAAALTAEKQQAETRADRAEGRVRELEALNRTQTEYVTDWHGQRKVELPDLATVDGQSAAWANMRAWEAGEKKRRKDEAAAKAGIEAELEAARERADTAEGRVRELEAGTASGTEAAAVREAQPVPDAAPKPPDLPAAWTLPVGELMKAGGAVAQAALTWGKEDSSPASMPLDGIADSPVLTFTPEGGLLRKRPAIWRYEDTGRYAGKAAIEIEHAFNGRDPAWSDWRAAAEVLSRALVTDALEDGAETPRWLEEQFPDLDKKYGPKIRTREYHGENPRTYVGETSGGEHHGAGTMTWKSGDRYEGAFENGHRHGQGVYDYPNGNRYEGAWQEGERHGQGVYTSADGSRYKGSWKAGKQHGAGVVISPSGEITEGVWEDGKRVEAAAKKTQTRSSRGRDDGR